MRMTEQRFDFIKAAGIVLAIGWVPLIVYIVFDAMSGGGGNPIGLGLWAAVCSLLACGLFIAEEITRRLRKRKGASS